MSQKDNPYYAQVICPEHQSVPLSYREYMAQLSSPYARWKCPTCGRVAEFDDAHYERTHQPPEDEGEDA